MVTKYTEYPKVMCQLGDILLTVKGSGTGKSTVADGSYCISRQLMAIRPTKFEPGYVQHILRRNERKYGDASAGLIPGISRADVLGTPLLVPSLAEQRKIAAALSTWDETIEKLEHLIAAKRERKRGLMQVLLTGKKRFKEFVVSDGLRQTRYGPLPADWRYLRVADMATEVSEKNRKNGDLSVLSCTKHQGLVDSLEYFGKQIYSKDTSTYKIVRRGCFAYATNHIDEGSIGYQDLYDEALISPMYTVFEANQSTINDHFLFAVLKTEHYRQIFAAQTSASVNRRGSLRWKDFLKIRIPLPTLEEQEKIASVLSTADAEIENLEKQLEAHKQQKRGLMQVLLTGKKRVTV